MDKRTDEFGLLQQWQDAIYDEVLAMTCNRRIGPYPCCSVVQGDCLDLLTRVPSDGIALVADPPYGINFVHGGNDSDSNPTKFAGIRVIGDDKPFDPSPFLCFDEVILWGANHYAERLPSSRGWLVWDKRCATVVNDHSDCELAWWNRGLTARMFYHMWDGFRRGSETGVDRLHPTQKPVCLMEWCVQKVSADTILDPFCGSGTTLVAAKRLGRHFLGFEISPEYCEIARKRLALIDAQPTLFEKKPEQTEFAL